MKKSNICPFFAGSSSKSSTPDLASGGVSSDEVKAWNTYYNSATVDGEKLSDEMNLWNPYYHSPPRAGYGDKLSDEIKFWNPYNDASPGAGFQSPKGAFVFTAGGGAGKRVDDTPFVPERGFYQPSTEETWEAYQALATLVQAQSRSNLPQVVLYGVADEVLSALKSPILRSPMAKKAEIEKILMPMPDHLFNQLVETGNHITDYHVRSPVSKTDDRVGLFVPEKDFYQPKSDVTCTAYNFLLEVVKNQMQYPQPQIVECVIAHEVLAILKKQDVLNARKKEMIEEAFLGKMPDDSFETLVFAADLISDFNDFNYSGIPAFGVNDLARNVYIDSQNTTKRPKRTPAGFEFGFDDSGRNSDQMELETPTYCFDEEANLVYSSDEETDPIDEAEDGICELSLSSPTRPEAEAKDEYSVDAKDVCSGGQESLITAGVCELSLSSPTRASAKDERSDEARDVCSGGQEIQITAGVRELSLFSPRPDANDEYSCDEETRVTAGVSELSLNSPKLEFSSEDESMYYEKATGSDKEDSDGWLQVDYEDVI